MRRIRLLIEFDGAPFAGWQRQANALSVQECLETALARTLGHPVTLHGAGRTDAGVHARGMAAHFDTPNSIPASGLIHAVSKHLHRSIGLLDAADAPPDFDARRGARLRWYRYQIDVSRRNHPLGPRAWPLFAQLDEDAMRRALALLEGPRDFQGFRASTCEATRTRLVMRQASLIRIGDLFILDFKCLSFLQRMVRLMVGAVSRVGRGKMTLEELAAIVATGARPDESPAAPPEGLCLMGIAYTPEEEENLLKLTPAAPSF